MNFDILAVNGVIMTLSWLMKTTYVPLNIW